MSNVRRPKPVPLYLRITSTPPGEAPLWVREKWVGLTLPLAQTKSTPIALHVSGVLTGPKGFFASTVAFLLGKYEKQSGYVVESTFALEVLAQRSPEAAAWWRQNVPHLAKPRRFLVFQQGVGYVDEPDA